MDSTARREGRLVAAAIGVFVVSMLVIFGVVARVALHQLDRIHGELDEFTETEISLTRIVTQVMQLQLKQRLALERLLRLQATGGDPGGKLLERAVAAFEAQSDGIHGEIRRGIGIAEAAGAIPRDTADEYSHLEQLLLALQREDQEFQAQAGELIQALQEGKQPDADGLLQRAEREGQHTGRAAASLLLELESFLEERGWQVEVHGRNAIRSIGLVAVVGSVVAILFGAYVLFSTFSHMEKRRRVEEALRSSEARHQANLSTLQDSAAELATLAGEVEISRHVEQRLRGALDLEWVESRLDPDRGRAGDLKEPVSFRGEVLGTISCGPKRSGEPFSTEEHQLLKSVAEQSAVALHNARTIQALRKANESLRRNARLVAIGEFAGAVAHGIRNPLAGIRAAAQAALKKAPEGPSADALATIMGEADQLNHRIRSLLDFSRPHELSLRKTDLRELVGSVSRAIARLPESERIRIVTDLPRVPVESEVDPDYLEEALLELSVNALRAMPNGGELRLHLEPSERGVSISVGDTGPGIPKAVRDRVFDLFFTTRPEGTGMGLAIVQKIIEAHRGTLELHQTGPEGTLFRVELGQTT